MRLMLSTEALVRTYTVETDVVIAVAALHQINFLYCGLHQTLGNNLKGTCQFTIFASVSV